MRPLPNSPPALLPPCSRPALSIPAPRAPRPRPLSPLARPAPAPLLTKRLALSAIAHTDDQASAFLGYDSKPFEFADLENDVSFVECSARQGGDTLQPIEIWLRTQYPA